MTQEEKQLLLKDLCARLPYGVKIKTSNGNGILCSIDYIPGGAYLGVSINSAVKEYFEYQDTKPYLRPMSSMTEEELLEQRTYKKDIMYQGFGTIELYMSWYIRWLDSKHFDWRKDGNGKTLIEKGLALEAPEGMY